MAAIAENERMSDPFDSFKVGDRVWHTTNGEGIVTEIGDAVHVVFDRVGTRGRHWEGSYPPSWFDIAECDLCHVTASQAEGG